MNYGINVIGIKPISEIIQISKIAEKNGFHSIWFGDAPNLRHIFPLLSTIADKTSTIKIGTSILSVNAHNPVHVLKCFQLLIKLYGNRFRIGLGRGGYKHLKMLGKENNKTFPIFQKYLTLLKNSLEYTPIYIGATGLKTLKTFGNKFDGVIINHLYPKFIECTIKNSKLSKRILAIAPAYYNPNKKEKINLILNAALIASEMPDDLAVVLGISDKISEIKKYYALKNIQKLSMMQEFLLEKFTLSGSLETFKNHADTLSKIGVNEIIYGHPISVNLTKFEAFAEKFSKFIK